MSTWRPFDADAADRQPRRVSDPLDVVVRRLGGPPADLLTRVFSGWEEMVGPDIAAHAVPVSLKRGVLVLSVDHPAWASQLRFMTAELLTRVSESTGSSEVSEIRLRVAGTGAPRNRRDTPLW